MPLYEYECKTCDDVVEILVRSQDEEVACPKCSSAELTRVLSVPSAPSMSGGSSSLPMAGGGEACGAPRCCGGGGCQM
ncbi:FmdB family zinc ribbon protein [Rhodopirellula islandica]|nr:zinc ribbon domain-containing protein [Rhodopirellula islandica]